MQGMEGDDESDELTARLSSLRLATNDRAPVDENVVFGHLAVTVKDAKAFKTQGLSLVLRVIYPKVYQTAIPDQQTRDVIGHTFSLHNITTEGVVVLEFFKGVTSAVKALRKVRVRARCSDETKGPTCVW